MLKFKKYFSLLIIAFLFISNLNISYATVSEQNVKTVLKDTVNYVHKTVKNPKVNSIGGEWAILGLSRSEQKIPQSYYDSYYSEVINILKATDGILHKQKYTDYSRVIIALTSIGKDPANVEGYSLLKPLGDYEKTIWQGVNGAIFALIALDSYNYAIPKNESAKIQATRDKYIEFILSMQLKDGGWALSGTKADPDITAMALQALAKYKQRPKVKSAIDKALDILSKLQNKNGGYESWGVENCESSAQVIVALCELGISVNDKRFIKNGKGLLDSLLSYYVKGSGFKHIHNSEVNQMSTEQALYALVSVSRQFDKKNSLYRMSDVKKTK